MVFRLSTDMGIEAGSESSSAQEGDDCSGHDECESSEDDEETKKRKSFMTGLGAEIRKVIN